MDLDFFNRKTTIVAKDLIGKWLVHRVKSHELIARVVETEAYLEDDPACHAYPNYIRKMQDRNIIGRSAPLFGTPGRAYARCFSHRGFGLNLQFYLREYTTRIPARYFPAFIDLGTHPQARPRASLMIRSCSTS